ncbi:hypothetical protein CBOM_08045 [Ceraceosorus bombacis]|uniref:Uncharacterized protein n=1 Tax=Ceraceosorus bombacis TaxID=401625 RepID=A0A0P1BK88_9BASI|nr:hypothetical protein CBOM_08045 [Ceraceosorus bombacis]
MIHDLLTKSRLVDASLLLQLADYLRRFVGSRLPSRSLRQKNRYTPLSDPGIPARRALRRVLKGHAGGPSRY